jgi:hypothetical protein
MVRFPIHTRILMVAVFRLVTPCSRTKIANVFKKLKCYIWHTVNQVSVKDGRKRYSKGNMKSGEALIQGTLVTIYKTTRCHNRKDHNPYFRRSGNFKPHRDFHIKKSRWVLAMKQCVPSDLPRQECDFFTIFISFRNERRYSHTFYCYYDK